MKKIYLLYIVLISLATTSLIGCSDWTESEAKTFPESIVSDEYYAALRAYKQTDHQVAFGWFGGWSGEGAGEAGPAEREPAAAGAGADYYSALDRPQRLPV